MNTIDPTETTQSTLLHRNSIRFIGTTASAVGIQAPTAGVTFLPALMAGIVGGSGPLAFSLALIAMLLVAYAFTTFSSEYASSGSIFVFNGKALGAHFGFVSTWMLLGVYIAFAASILASNANFLVSLTSGTGIAIPWQVYSLLFLALVILLTYRKIAFSTMTIFLLELVAIALVLVVAVVVLLKGGYGGHSVSLAPFTSNGVSIGTIGLGVIFAFTGFSGFEVAATLGEETHRPRRLIPLSMVVALVVSGGIYIVMSWIETIAYPHTAQLANATVPLVSIAQGYISPVMGTVINVAAIVSGIGALLATINGANRLVFALSREGRGPRWFSAIHPRHNSPIGALGIVGGVTLVSVLPFMFTAVSPLDVFFYLATYGADLIIVVYFMTSVAALVWSIRTHHRGVKRLSGLSAAIVVMGYIIKGTVYPLPVAPFNYCIVAALLTIGIGVLLSFIPILRMSFDQSYRAAVSQTEA